MEIIGISKRFLCIQLLVQFLKSSLLNVCAVLPLFFFLIMWVISFELISPTTIRLSIGLPNKLLVKDFMCSQGTSL